ncbi:MAG: DoxX family protein [Ginsengibacter sp.]
MNKIIATNSNNWPALIARLALGLTIFPHGAQKLLGWFGGYGFTGTMGYFTGTVGLPWVIGFLFIIIEFFAPLFLFLGLGTRIASAVIIVSFIGVMLTDAIHNGFFMNWAREAGKGEGLEYFVLLFGVAFISLVAGGGKASIDAALIQNEK